MTNNNIVSKVWQFATTPDKCIHINIHFQMCLDCGQVWDDEGKPIIQVKEATP